MATIDHGLAGIEETAAIILLAPLLFAGGRRGEKGWEISHVAGADFVRLLFVGKEA